MNFSIPSSSSSSSSFTSVTVLLVVSLACVLPPHATQVHGLAFDASRQQQRNQQAGFTGKPPKTTTSKSALSYAPALYPDETAKPPIALDSKSDKTTLGNLHVPSIGIGTISWSSTNPFALENQALQSLVNTAAKEDALFFDTAERYGSHYKTALGMGWGETERLTKKLLDSVPGHDESGSTNHDPIVATKFTPSPWRTTVDSVVEACRDSAERLGVEQIDLYQLHMPDIVQPLRRFGGQGFSKDETYWKGLAECQRLGLVKNVGVSNYGPTLLTRCQDVLSRYDVSIASNQISYSLVGRHNGAQETVDFCNDNGIKVLASFPFAMGLLTGKYSSSDEIEKLVSTEGDMLSLWESKKSRLENIDLQRYSVGDGETVPVGGIGPLLDVMNDIATARGKTVAQVALNYIVCQGVIPIPGARTSAQVRDNLGSLGWRLTVDEIARLEAASDALGFGFDGAGFKRTSEKFVGYGIERWRLD